MDVKCTVLYLKKQIYYEANVALADQMLCNKGRCLDEFKHLRDYGITDNGVDVWLIMKNVKIVIVSGAAM